MANGPEWITLTQEEALEPDLPIIDPHHHLWNRPAQGTRYVLEDILADTEGNNVRRVFGHIEGDFHMALRGQIVDLVRADILQNAP